MTENTVSDINIDEDIKNFCSVNTSRPNKALKLDFEVPCDWPWCNEKFSSIDPLGEHIHTHFRDLKDEHVCGICNKDLSTASEEILEVHVYIHAWSAYLRGYGEAYRVLKGLPKCTLNGDLKHEVPYITESFACGWEYCDFVTNKVHVYFCHVSTHPQEYYDSRYERNPLLKCQWEGCDHMSKRVDNLSLHLSAHTQEKRLMCPTCGAGFSRLDKFKDHLNRQVVVNTSMLSEEELSSLKCSKCFKVFPNAKLLLSHTRRHIHSIKCPKCNMTCNSPSILKVHIHNRHEGVKSVECPCCNYKTVSKQYLLVHLRRRHEGQYTTIEDPLSENCIVEKIETSQNENDEVPEVKLFNCDECDFKGKHRRSLQTHLSKVHPMIKTMPVYECHICQYTTSRGYLMSVHLMKEHKFSRPAGHTRFQYRMHEDKKYRLISSVHTTLTLAKEILGENKIKNMMLNMN